MVNNLYFYLLLIYRITRKNCHYKIMKSQQSELIKMGKNKWKKRLVKMLDHKSLIY